MTTEDYNMTTEDYNMTNEDYNMATEDYNMATENDFEEVTRGINVLQELADNGASFNNTTHPLLR